MYFCFSIVLINLADISSASYSLFIVLLSFLFLLLFYMTFSLFPTSPFVTSYFPTTFSNTFPILLSLPLPTLFLFLILLSLPLYYFFIPISQIFYIETSNHPIYFWTLTVMSKSVTLDSAVLSRKRLVLLLSSRTMCKYTSMLLLFSFFFWNTYLLLLTYNSLIWLIINVALHFCFSISLLFFNYNFFVLFFCLLSYFFGKMILSFF